MTKDERFLYELLLLKNQGTLCVDPKELGKKLGYSEHIIKNIIQGLAKANFIKKTEEGIAITALGESIAEQLRP